MAADYYDEVVGEVLAETRQALGLTQGDVAQAVGISPQMIGFYERANTRCSVGMLMRIAIRAFGENPSELMKRVEQKIIADSDD